jgi:hypothetical protein
MMLREALFCEVPEATVPDADGEEAIAISDKE